MNGTVTTAVSTSDTDWPISTPSSPTTCGRISTVGARNRPCRHTARNEAMPVLPIVWVIMLPIMLNPLSTTVQHWMRSAATPTFSARSTVATFSERESASLLVGRDVRFGDLPGGQAAGEERLVIRGLCALGDRGLPALRGMDLTVRAGEVVGVCGVEGNGQTELAECVAGMRPVMGGSVTLCGRDVTGQTPGRIREAGLSYIPEDRISTGMDVKASVAENLIVGKQRTPAFSRLGIHLRRGQVK